MKIRVFPIAASTFLLGQDLYYNTPTTQLTSPLLPFLRIFTPTLHTPQPHAECGGAKRRPHTASQEIKVRLAAEGAQVCLTRCSSWLRPPSRSRRNPWLHILPVIQLTAEFSWLLQHSSHAAYLPLSLPLISWLQNNTPKDQRAYVRMRIIHHIALSLLLSTRWQTMLYTDVCLLIQSILSRSRAMPWPPPTQAEPTALRRPLRLSSWTRWPVIRDPEVPSGWPRAGRREEERERIVNWLNEWIERTSLHYTVHYSSVYTS